MPVLLEEDETTQPMDTDIHENEMKVAENSSKKVGSEQQILKKKV